VPIELQISDPYDMDAKGRAFIVAVTATREADVQPVVLFLACA
jgi:hypothetical protein